MYACLGVACHLHFWQNDQGFLCAAAVQKVEQTPNKRQHTKLTLEKKILLLLLPGFELATFRSQVRHSNQQAISAPHVTLYVREMYQTIVEISASSWSSFTCTPTECICTRLLCSVVLNMCKYTAVSGASVSAWYTV